MKRKRLVAKLRQALAKESNVSLAYLFGSTASGPTTPLSDLDVAVELKRPGLGELGELWSKIAEATETHEDSVDLIDLSSASLTLTAQVLNSGLRLVGTDEDEARLRDRIVSAYPDARYMVHALVSEVLDGGAIDESVVEAKLGALMRYTAILDRILTRSERDLLGDDVARGALERYVHLSIESILDICKHFVARLRLGAPETHRELVNRLASSKVIDRKLADELLKLAGLRNILVHRYSEVNASTLYASSGEISEIANRFATRIRAKLREAKP